MGDLVPRIYLTNIKLLPLALCGDVYEGDETALQKLKYDIHTKLPLESYQIRI